MRSDVRNCTVRERVDAFAVISLTVPARNFISGDLLMSRQGFGPLSKAHPECCLPLLKRWSDSEDMWERRVAILFQLRYGDGTDEAFLFDTIRKACSSNLRDEFFIQKAIGWALRTYRRSSPSSVDTFVEQESANLSKLSVREARK
jgi:DNA alkylation repair enzyme